MGVHSKCSRIVYGVTFGVLLVLAIALLSTHTVFIHMFARRQARVPAGRMVHSQCALVNVRVSEVHGQHAYSDSTQQEYAAVWEAVRSDSPSVYHGVITSPFGFRTLEQQAHLDAAAWPVNASYPCTCPHYNQSTAYHYCMLETDIVRYLQHEARWYRYAESTLVGVGVVALVFAMAGISVLLWDTRCFWTCCQRVTGGYVRAYDEDETGQPMTHFSGGKL